MGREYYDEVFFDLATKAKLEGAAEIRRDMERRRHIKALLKGTFSVAKLEEHIAMLRDVLDFTPAAIMMDGYDFDSATPEGLEELRAIARKLKAEFWMSAHTYRESKRDAVGVPEPVAAVKHAIDVILAMAHDGKSVHVRLLKDHDNPDVSVLPLALDRTTMLLVKE